jgi:D-lyxose ketol-isomerase
MRKGQTCPTHYHVSKMEDIINRSGETLCFELHMAGKDGKSYSEKGFSISRDGVEMVCKPGEVIELDPGESITLPPYIYHSFWAEGGDVLVGEVSRVNDDETDNFFYTDIPRFTEIDEDEEPLYLLCHELKKLLD